jgi:hypothetical protein
VARPQTAWTRRGDLFLVFFVVPMVAISTGVLTLALAVWTLGPPGR